MLSPIYTPANCTPAFQLRWSLALFTKVTIDPDASQLDQLRSAVESDGVRILEHTRKSPDVWLFLLSTQPSVAPPQIVKSVKGRWQHLLHAVHPNAFQRNFSLTSVGDASGDVIDAYVESQLGHHRMADERVQHTLGRFQMQFPEVDLTEPRFSSHGRYVYNLHVVLVHDGRWCETREEKLETTRAMILNASHKKEHRLSRLSLFADHLHMTAAVSLRDSPEAVALGYMNNVSFAHGMQPLFQHSYYVGTFGPYDMGAVWRGL